MNRLNDQILEDFITQHRKELEVFEPPAEMWQHIAGELDEHTPAMSEGEEDSDIEKLEHFISQNQSALDLFEPPVEAWQNIAGELDKTKKGEPINAEESKLEGFVLEKQDELDIFEPPVEMWQKISGALDMAPLEENKEEEFAENTQTKVVSRAADDELLEQFITQNKDELNMFDPPADAWQHISGELDKDNAGKVITLSYRSVWKITSAAAAIVLVGFMGFKLWGGQQPASNNNIAQTEDSTLLKNTLATDFNLKELDPELAEAESYYTELIAEKKQELDKYSLDDVTLKEEFKGDISELDSTYNSLRKELYSVPGKDKVSEAMILNLQTRIEILNQQLKILEKAKKKKKPKKNEKMDI